MHTKDFITETTLKTASSKQTISNFIVFEGIDGSGKSTQLKLLEDKISSTGAFFTAEPTNLHTGKFLRSILKGEVEAHPTTVVHLFAADRAEHLYGKGGILENCNNGKLCVCDRYLFSNLAYQGVTCGEELPAKLNDNFPLPELVIYFDIEPRESLKRAQSRGEAEIYEKLDFLESTHTEYEKVFKYYEKMIAKKLTTMKIVRIDASQSQEKISEIVWSYIEPSIKSL